MLIKKKDKYFTKISFLSYSFLIFYRILVLPLSFNVQCNMLIDLPTLPVGTEWHMQEFHHAGLL